jgi:hypothetical protein
MINIDGKDYTVEEIQQVFHLCRELLQANEDMRANVIAMSAKLENEEKKVKNLEYKYFFLQQQTINKYEA